MTQFTIDPEFSTLCPALADDERVALEADLLARGCREPLVVWKEQSLLLDGHHRGAICDRHDIHYTTIEYPFADRTAAATWIIDNALARRNLTPAQASYLRGKRYENQKKNREENLLQNAPTAQIEQSGEDTAARVASDTGVSRATVVRDAEFAKAVDEIERSAGPEAKTAILSGRVKLTRASASEVAAARPDSVATVQRLAKKPPSNCSPIEMNGRGGTRVAVPAYEPLSPTRTRNIELKAELARAGLDLLGCCAVSAALKQIERLHLGRRYHHAKVRRAFLSDWAKRLRKSRRRGNEAERDVIARVSAVLEAELAPKSTTPAPSEAAIVVLDTVVEEARP